jgi:RNA polymerase sigma factor (sigma-70 family)
MPLQGHDVRGDGDEDLLVYVGWKAEHPELANAACDEFYRRHLKYVYAVIDRAYGSELGTDGVVDMVTDTFLRVYERASTYQPCGEKDPDRQRRNALAWVSTIALNLCKDHFRNPDTQIVLVDEWSDATDPAARSEQYIAPALDGDLKCIHEAMEKLSEREQAILRVTMDYWKPGSEHQRLPNDVAEELARTFDITSDNLRKIRERALRKLRASVDECKKTQLQGVQS